VLTAAGCGSTSFGAEEFVKKANENGAGIELGPSLGSSQPGKKTYEVDLVVAPGSPQPTGEENGLRGSLSTYDTQEAADRGLRECQATTELLCYQAANVVMVFGGSQPNAVQLRLAAALKKMGD
jgi:hypothetical protein